MGHNYECATFRSASPSIAPASYGIDLYGRLHKSPAFVIGFIHYGTYSECTRCGHINDNPDTALPVVYPEFMHEPITALPATSLIAPVHILDDAPKP